MLRVNKAFKVSAGSQTCEVEGTLAMRMSRQERRGVL